MFSLHSSSRALAALALCLTASACGAVGCGVEREAPATAAPAPALVPSTVDERAKIVVLGDSLTAGLGLTETEAYPALLQRMIDSDGYEFEVINAGVSGDTTAGGLRRLEWVMKEDVQVVIVALGANDGLRGLPIAQMKENLSRIIEMAKSRSAAVIVAGMEAPPNYGPEYAASFRQVFADVARQHRVVFVPFLLAGVAGNSTLNQQDGIHPTAEGQAIIADTVWKALHPILDQIANS